jgi:hypothetical protein
LGYHQKSKSIGICVLSYFHLELMDAFP